MKWRWQFVCLLLCSVSRVGAPQSISRPVSACAACHDQAKFQPATGMAHALETVEECQTLVAHPLMTFQDARYSYRIERRGDQSIYSVSDGVESLSMPIRWAMGASAAIGETYVLEKDGQLYESRVSYFSELKGLGITMGAGGSMPTNIVDAAGRVMGRDDKLRCFGCHATNATQGRELTLDTMTPGVQCERCHGPSDKHLAGLRQANPEMGAMKHLGALSTDEVSTFCGQCHRTWEEIALSGKLDITDIRFQPYRLVGSKCYDPDDARISCLACHDVHHAVDTKTTDYDSKCQACHAGGKPKARTCKVSTSHCASCHMPKIELPGAHHRFTDHRIRIARANEPFPG
ncbi:MAG TPA: multiheme c-type cytochrome [Terriglobia bacterium]|nr:multiheme c-type cytochrome [Terriglobia bacterium]